MNTTFLTNEKIKEFIQELKNKKIENLLKSNEWKKFKKVVLTENKNKINLRKKLKWILR